MKRTDLAYIAGIIDGEGCISIERRRYAEGKYKKIVSLTVSNTEEWLCQWLKLSWGGRIRIRIDKRENHLPLYNWVVYRAKAIEVLKVILPYLKIKKPQAEIAIGFQSRRSRCRLEKTDEEKALDEAEYILLKNLKKQRA